MKTRRETRRNTRREFAAILAAAIAGSIAGSSIALALPVVVVKPEPPHVPDLHDGNWHLIEIHSHSLARVCRVDGVDCAVPVEFSTDMETISKVFNDSIVLSDKLHAISYARNQERGEAAIFSDVAVWY